MYPLSVALFSTALFFHNGVGAVAVNRGVAGDAILAARASRSVAPSASASAPANTDINVAAVSSKASAYGSSVIAASTLQAYSQPSEAVTQFLAIG